MYEVVALALVVLLATCGYAAGRLHGQHSHRLGYRLGYRQGYFDGDRSSWIRRRRELQAVVTTVLTTPVPARSAAFADEVAGGAIYASRAEAEADELDVAGPHRDGPGPRGDGPEPHRDDPGGEADPPGLQASGSRPDTDGSGRAPRLPEQLVDTR